MGYVGRERAFILRQANANVKLLSDLHGLIVLEYQWPTRDRNELSAVGVACNKMRRAVRDLGIFHGNEKQLALVANEVQELGGKAEKLRSEVAQQESDLRAIRVALRGIVTKWEIDYLRDWRELVSGTVNGIKILLIGLKDSTKWDLFYPPR
jgi:hypothetical protein